MAGSRRRPTAGDRIDPRDLSQDRCFATENDLYRRTIADAPIAIVAIDLRGQVQVWNPAAEAMFGWSGEEVLGHVVPIIPDDRMREYWDLIDQVRSGRTLSNLRRVRLHRDGSRRRVLMSAAPLRNLAGEITGSLAFIQDVTEQVQVRSDLAASEQRFRRMFDAAAAGIAVTDLNGRFHEANPSYCRLTGYSLEELRSLAFPMITHPDDRDRNLAFYRRLVAGEIPHFVLEKRVIRKDGGVVWCRVSVAVGQDIGKDSRYTIAIIEDITQRHQAEQSLKKLNRELEHRVSERTRALRDINEELQAFTYSVSHDLRAPLRAINGWTQAVIEDHAHRLDGDGRRMLGRLRSAAQAMGQLIDDLLRLSQVSSRPLRRRTINPGPLVQEVWRELLQQRDAAKQVELRVDPLPTCFADPPLLRRVFVNLLDNAVKFSQGSRRPIVDVGAVPPTGPDRCPRYFVRDHGVGFDPRYAAKLFTPFQRLHRQDEFSGTGVGLAIVQRIVHRHGGQIWAESSPGKGAVFYFTLTQNPDDTSGQGKLADTEAANHETP